LHRIVAAVIYQYIADGIVIVVVICIIVPIAIMNIGMILQ
jgi:hypothetical protein